MRRVALLSLFVTGASFAVGGVGSAAGQTVDAREEGRLLRQAASLESRGDHGGAEQVLRGLLERHPSSSGGLFALERVLSSRGTLSQILPLADAFLAVEPRAGGAWNLKLRVMVEIDSLETLESEARRWMEAEPGSTDLYREVARVFEAAYGAERALEILQEGRETLGESTALAVESGDLLLQLGRGSEAVQEWGRAIGADGSQLSTILRRIEQLEGESSEMVRPLVEALDTPPTTPERRRAGIRIALEVGLEAEALELAQNALGEVSEESRRGFLSDMARRGDEDDAPSLALWAYQSLREITRDRGERASLDARIAAAALAAGDTLVALDAQRRLAQGLPVGSVERRRVVADMIRVELNTANAATLSDRLAGFRSEFPAAPELDELASLMASSLRSRGEEGAAVELLAGVEGPRSSLERAYLLLASGDLEAGKGALAEALEGLAPSEATEIIQLVGLLERLGGQGARVVADAAVLAHRGRPEEAIRSIEGALDGLAAADQAPLLAQAARLADQAGLTPRGAELRSGLLARYPDAPEVGEATLLLARYRAQEADGIAVAVRLLEELILKRPNAPVVPDARRELERLRRDVPPRHSASQDMGRAGASPSQRSPVA